MTQTGFREVGDQVFVARYPQWDVNVGLVLGAERALVVDTRAGAAQGRGILADARGLLRGRPVQHVVNTHVHFDHTFGNVVFRTAVIHAHQRVVDDFAEEAEQIRARMRADPQGAPELGYTAADIADALTTELRAPDVAVTGPARLDLGGRTVELRHLGLGHTDGDLVVSVPDADVVFAGDLVEQSGPPSYGADSWPLSWPDTLTALTGRLGPATTVVPGHGRPVDRTFVHTQLAEVDAVATLIRHWHGQGRTAEAAAETDDPRLPYPAAALREAFRRGWWQLSRETDDTAVRP